MSIFTYALIFFVVLFLFSGIFVVKQQSAAIVERFGRFLSIRQSGLHFRIPVMDRISGRIESPYSPTRCYCRNQNQRRCFCKIKGVRSI